ncbi:hypothetical protein C474_19619 [Halogeometricum pallidum JCM 14848]|uniref:Type I phosphodiesterase/nucleotide pyrophosphatase n=2 Tax=Halogeometricum TaxID=60846 RepID=M0CSZ6_HALPD|nr:hypothetical protein C474_19619 [Halogeometricum pallidum JCM 14848]
MLVLALDGTDLRLAEQWECDNLLLDRHGQIDTFAYSRDQPWTPEVWTAVAAGEHPRDTQTVEPEWNHPVLRFASNITRNLPLSVRSRLGDLVEAASVESREEMNFPTISGEHAFTNAEVKGWPGVTPANNLLQTWDLYRELTSGTCSKSEHHAPIVANHYEEIGWLRGHACTGTPLAACHLHLLDTMGHIYADRPESLKQYYLLADEQVGSLRDETDRMIILSDHGMKTGLFDDDRLGSHSWRAMVSATEDVEGTLPTSVFDVREWIESQDTTVSDRNELSPDTDREQLEALGYI